MPLYEYRCQTCGEFEACRTLADWNTPMSCPTCKAVAQKMFSPPNVNLNSGSLPRQGTKEPRLVKRREPATPRYQSRGGRPWMISH